MAEPNRKPSSHPSPARKPVPISRHPLFPAIVGLWFAALLGLGSLSLSTSLLETVVLAANLDRIVPAATPPLGMTARLLLALVLGGAGGALGWFLARRLARPRPAEAAPQVFKVAETDLAPAPAVFVPAPTPVEETDGPVFATVPVAHEPEPESEPESEAEILPARETPILAQAAAAPAEAAQRIARADLADLSHVELVERLAMAIQVREQLRDAVASDDGSASAVVRFPAPADRQSARAAPAPLRPVPHETEKALREALSQLQRMSGNG